MNVKDFGKKHGMAMVFLFAIIFLLSGIITNMMAPSLSKGAFIVTLFINLSSSSLLLVIVYWIYLFTGENPILDSLRAYQAETVKMMNFIIRSDTVRQSYYETGVSRFFPERGDTARIMWNEFIENRDVTPVTVEVLGKVLNRVQGSFITEKERDIIVEKINLGTKIYILLIEPDSKPAQLRAEDESNDQEHSTVGHDKIRNPKFIRAVKDVINRTKHNQNKGCLVVGYYSETPYCQITRIGDEMLVTNYLTGHSGRECPSMALNREHQDDVFNRYQETFYKILELTHARNPEPSQGPALYHSEAVELIDA